MHHGRGGMGSHKHYVSGRAGKSPKQRHALKRQAEAQVVKDKSRIKDPKKSIKDLFHKK